MTKCDKLEYLECCHAYELTHIALSNRSALKKLVFDAYTPLSDKSLEIIKRIVERNGGEIMSNSFDFEQFKVNAIEQLKTVVPLSGKDGVLAPLLEKLLNSALEGEMDSH